MGSIIPAFGLKMAELRIQGAFQALLPWSITLGSLRPFGKILRREADQVCQKDRTSAPHPIRRGMVHEPRSPYITYSNQTLSTLTYRLSVVLHPRDDRSIRRLK